MDSEQEVVARIKKIIIQDPEYWDFKEESTKKHIHNLINYPATMVPVMQSEIIKLFKAYDSSINSVLDPFMGSGTTLIESNINGLDAVGIDINPFAYLIVLVKTSLVDMQVYDEICMKLEKSLKEETEYSIHYFNKIDKWFKPDVIDKLSKIRTEIKKIDNVLYRRVFWIVFSKTVQESSNDRSSTFKLHAKAEIDIEKFNPDVIKIFITNMKRVKDAFNEYYSEYYNNSNNNIFCGDSIEILQTKFEEKSQDLIVTSPPYGDNGTTVTYGQFSSLQLRWIDLDDIGCEINSSLMSSYSAIDSKSLGGCKYTQDRIIESGILNRSQTLSNIYNLLSKSDFFKARKVASFYIDYEKSLHEIFRVLKDQKCAVFTVGNRKVDGREVKLDDVTIELVSFINVQLVYKFTRKIKNKRMPGKVSRLKNKKPVSSMKEETVLILKKMG
jgi:hypothetical protein